MNAVANDQTKELKAKVRRLERQLKKALIIGVKVRQADPEIENLAEPLKTVVRECCTPVRLGMPINYDQAFAENERLKQENFELGVQIRSLERENGNYLKIIDKACCG